MVVLGSAGQMGEKGYFQPRVMRHTTAMGVEYAVHDVIFAGDGSVESYTQAARSNRFPSVAELKQWLLEMLEAGHDAINCGDLGYAHTRQEHLPHWLEHIDDAVIDYVHEAS